MFNSNEITNIVDAVKSYFLQWEKDIKKNYKEMVKDFTKQEAIELSHFSYNSDDIHIEFKTKEDIFWCRITWKDYLEYLNNKIKDKEQEG